MNKSIRSFAAAALASLLVIVPATPSNAFRGGETPDKVFDVCKSATELDCVEFFGIRTTASGKVALVPGKQVEFKSEPFMVCNDEGDCVGMNNAGKPRWEVVWEGKTLNYFLSTGIYGTPRSVSSQREWAELSHYFSGLNLFQTDFQPLQVEYRFRTSWLLPRGSDGLNLHPEIRVQPYGKGYKWTYRFKPEEFFGDPVFEPETTGGSSIYPINPYASEAVKKCGNTGIYAAYSQGRTFSDNLKWSSKSGGIFTTTIGSLNTEYGTEHIKSRDVQILLDTKYLNCIRGKSIGKPARFAAALYDSNDQKHPIEISREWSGEVLRLKMENLPDSSFELRIAPLRGSSQPATASQFEVYQKTLSTFSGSSTALSAQQKLQVKQAVEANPEAEKFICTGIRFEAAPMSQNIIVRKRAKAACDYAKTLNPNLSTWFQNKPTKATSYAGKVLLTVKSP